MTLNKLSKSSIISYIMYASYNRIHGSYDLPISIYAIIQLNTSPNIKLMYRYNEKKIEIIQIFKDH